MKEQNAENNKGGKVAAAESPRDDPEACHHERHSDTVKSLLFVTDIGSMHIDDRSHFIQFNRHQFAIFHSLCFLPHLGQWKDFLAVSRLQHDLLLHPADVNELAGHQLMLAPAP